VTVWPDQTEVEAGGGKHRADAVAVAFADAFGLGRMQGIDFGSALALS